MELLSRKYACEIKKKDYIRTDTVSYNSDTASHQIISHSICKPEPSTQNTAFADKGTIQKLTVIIFNHMYYGILANTPYYRNTSPNSHQIQELHYKVNQRRVHIVPYLSRSARPGSDSNACTIKALTHYN